MQWFKDIDNVWTILKDKDSIRTYKFPVNAGQKSGGGPLNVGAFDLSVEGPLNVLSSGVLNNEIIVQLSGYGELTININTSTDNIARKYVDDGYVDCGYVDGNACFVDTIPVKLRFKELKNDYHT